jgi:hypothetical protein
MKDVKDIETSYTPFLRAVASRVIIQTSLFYGDVNDITISLIGYNTPFFLLLTRVTIRVTMTRTISWCCLDFMCNAFLGGGCSFASD